MSESNGIERRYKEVTFADGRKFLLRSLTRAEMRVWKKVTPTEDDEYFFDVLLSFSWIDPETKKRVITTEEAVAGYFDKWDGPEAVGLANAAYRHVMEKLAALRVEDAIKNSDTTPGSDSCGNSAVIAA